MYTKLLSVFYMALGLDDFDGGQIHFEGHWKGWALKIETFFGPWEWQRAKQAPFRHAPYKQQVH
jgi:hypothetical protein